MRGVRHALIDWPAAHHCVSRWLSGSITRADSVCAGRLDQEAAACNLVDGWWMGEQKRRQRQAEKIDPTALVWHRDTLADQLGVSRSTLLRMEADGRIPAPIAIGRNRGWQRDEAEQIVRSILITSGRGSPIPIDDAMSLKDIHTALVAHQVTAKAYWQYLPLAEALHHVMEWCPQLRPLLERTAAREGITPRKPAMAGVTFQGPTGQFVRLADMQDDGTCEATVADSRDRLDRH
jgi:predicted DNA-binding transcriptional regulator AlpA